MRFIEEPSSLDYRLIPIIREYIDMQAWDLVLEEIEEIYLPMIKTQLLKMHREKPSLNFDVLAECESVSDVLHARDIVIVYGAEPFFECLLAAYKIEESLLLYQPFNDYDEIKEDFHNDVDRLQQYLKEALLVIMLPEIWANKKIKSGLVKGRKASKEMPSLNSCITEILLQNGFDTKPELVKRKIRTFTDERPYSHRNYIMKYDSESDKIYQVDEKSGRERSVSMKAIYAYMDRIKKKYS